MFMKDQQYSDDAFARYRGDGMVEQISVPVRSRLDPGYLLPVQPNCNLATAHSSAEALTELVARPDAGLHPDINTTVRTDA
jgi:hypothetical protein